MQLEEKEQRTKAVKKILERTDLKPWPLQYWKAVLEKLTR